MRPGLWVLEPGMVAHLVDPTRTEERPDSYVGWCGMVLRHDQIEHAGYRPRCKDCVRLVNEWSAAATEPLPELVVDTVTVSVVRPSGSGADLADIIRMAFHRKRSWTALNIRSQEVYPATEADLPAHKQVAE